ncbi:MAG: Dabb family protein [Vicinamibacterales bacterium]
MISHIVLFSPKSTLSPGETRALISAVHRAFSEIPSVIRVRVGKRVDVDAGYLRSFGQEPYSYSAVAEFDSVAELQTYLAHPLHHELGKLFWQTCDRCIVSEMDCVDGKDPTELNNLVS